MNSSIKLPYFQYIDTQLGLKYLHGNKKLYLKLLKDFYAAHHTDMAVIKEAIASSDLSLCERVTHTVKGLAGTLGAGALQKSAALAESQVKQGALAEQTVATLETELNTVMQAIKGLFTTHESDVENSVEEINYEEITKLLEKLGPLLDELSPDAEDLVEKLQEKLAGSLFEAQVSKLLSQTVDFEFEDAQETCVILQNMMKKTSA